MLGGCCCRWSQELGDGAANAIDSNPAHFWSLIHTAHGWLAAGKDNYFANTQLWRSTAADGSGWTKVEYNFNNSNNRVGLYAVPGEAVVFAVVGGAGGQWVDIFRSQDSGATFVPLNVLGSAKVDRLAAILWEVCGECPATVSKRNARSATRRPPHALLAAPDLR